MATNIREQVRKAIDSCGMSRYAISRATGVSEGMLSRFMSSETDMTLRTLDRLSAVIGVRLVIDRPKRRRKDR